MNKIQKMEKVIQKVNKELMSRLENLSTSEKIDIMDKISRLTTELEKLKGNTEPDLYLLEKWSREAEELFK